MEALIWFLIFLSVYTFSEEKYTWNKLVSEADYVVNVSRNIMRCEETDRYYVTHITDTAVKKYNEIIRSNASDFIIHPDMAIINQKM